MKIDLRTTLSHPVLFLAVLLLASIEWRLIGSRMNTWIV